MTSVWQAVLDDVSEPGVMWQFAALASVMLIAWIVERYFSKSKLPVGRGWEIGSGGVLRVVFPLVSALLVLAAIPLLRGYTPVNFLVLAVPLYLSLAGIRCVFYVLRYSLPSATWLASFERVFATLVWMIVALYIAGVLPDVIDALESVEFHVGKQSLSLWQILQGLTTVLVTVLAALWFGGVIEARLHAAVDLDRSLREVFSRLAKALLVLIAVLISLPIVGIDLTTLSVFGGALGVGLGFGLQKIASNYVSGFILLLDRSIKIGNMISVGNDRGVVTRITTRFTVLKNFSGVEALVPNDLLMSSVVANETYTDHRVRSVISVQVSYSSDVDLAMKIMEEAAKAQDRVLADPPVAVLMSDFGDSGIKLDVGFWIADPEQGTGEIRSAINMAVWRGFNAAGIQIPFPQREVRILGANHG
jgi:small-conductance mechanosensitive channel